MVNTEYWFLFQTQKGATLIGKKKQTQAKAYLSQYLSKFQIDLLKLRLIFTLR